jgi:hypothetical protein
MNKSVPILNISFNASGASQAGKRGDVVLVVDVVDMSTSAEAALEHGALSVYGVAPEGIEIPAKTDYNIICELAIGDAKKNSASIILVTEPRIAKDSERKATVQKVHDEVVAQGIAIDGIVANQGIELPKLIDFKNKVVIIASQTGGSAFDAAVCAGSAKVLTGTVVRTMKTTGQDNIKKAAKRAIEAAIRFGCGITVVAATANSVDDYLGAQQISYEILREGFLSLKTV